MIREIELAISKLELASGTVLTVALRDITERKALEMEQKVLAEAGPVLASSLNSGSMAPGAKRWPEADP